MKERPILFSGAMVRAILEGRKTQTRRVIKPQPEYKPDFPPKLWTYDPMGAPRTALGWRNIDNTIGAAICPYGALGDTLWLRETWDDFGTTEPMIVYRADTPNPFTSGEPQRWRPSIHMPRWASRITLEVTGVRAERVQDISEEDAQAEGVPPNWAGSLDGWNPEEHGFLGVLDDPNTDDQDGYFRDGRDAFEQLWDSINAKRGYGWQVNPFCWVIEFKRVQP